MQSEQDKQLKRDALVYQAVRIPFLKWRCKTKHMSPTDPWFRQVQVSRPASPNKEEEEEIGLCCFENMRKKCVNHGKCI